MEPKKRIAYKNDENGVSIVNPGINCSLSIKELAKKDVPASPDGTPRKCIFVDQQDMPSDREFRDAWYIEGEKIGIDIQKARSIHMSKIRKVRNIAIKELDGLVMRAIEVGDEVELKRLSIAKQVLREIPSKANLDRFVSVEELKLYWPEELSA